MPWFYVDDAFADSKPVMRLDRSLRNAAIGLWVRCGAWSAKEETDGHVPMDVVRQLDGTPRLVRALEEQAGLWLNFDEMLVDTTRETTGKSSRKSREIMFANWEKWQKTHAENVARRKREAEKKSTYRASKKGRDYVAASDNVEMSTGDTPGDRNEADLTNFINEANLLSTGDSPGESLYPDPTRPSVVTQEGVYPVGSGPDSTHTPTPFCDKHPNGTRDRCGDCANARRAFDAWKADQADREREATEAVEADRRTIREAIDDCPDCDDFGRLDDLTPCPKHPNFGEGRRAHG